MMQKATEKKILWVITGNPRLFVWVIIAWYRKIILSANAANLGGEAVPSTVSP
jgi:hypothetical protein